MGEETRELSLGFITEPENEALKRIYDRRMALMSLARTLATLPDKTSNDLYSRLVADSTSVEGDMRHWWEGVCRDHGWENPAVGSWSVNFQTKAVTVYLPIAAGGS